MTPIIDSYGFLCIKGVFALQSGIKAYFLTPTPQLRYTKVTRFGRAHISSKLVKSPESSQIRSALPSDVTRKGTLRPPCFNLLHYQKRCFGSHGNSIFTNPFSLLPADKFLRSEILCRSLSSPIPILFGIYPFILKKERLY